MFCYSMNVSGDDCLRSSQQLKWRKLETHVSLTLTGWIIFSHYNCVQQLLASWGRWVTVVTALALVSLQNINFFLSCKSDAIRLHCTNVNLHNYISFKKVWGLGISTTTAKQGFSFVAVWTESSALETFFNSCDEFSFLYCCSSSHCRMRMKQIDNSLCLAIWTVWGEHILFLRIPWLFITWSGK